LQVGFAALSLKAVPYGHSLQAAERVLSHQLSTGALWEEIRMKGGAYGVFAQPDPMEGPFCFSSYRDPNPLASLEAFSSILKKPSRKNGKNGLQSSEALTKAVIGTYSKLIRPRTPAERGIADFMWFLYGIKEEHRTQHIKNVIAVTDEQIEAARERLVSDTGHTWPVIIAGKAEAEKAAAQLGAELKFLPV
jgi:Zn-dependent M16 (insulinase) family peptidase